MSALASVSSSSPGLGPGDRPRPPSRAHLGAYLATVVVLAGALVMTGILLVDYLRPTAVFCSDAQGCGAIRQTWLAYPGGIPLPVFGLAGLLALSVAVFWSGARARLAQLSMALLGGLGALTFIGIQVALNTYCVYCMSVDGAMIVLALLSGHRWSRQWDPTAGWTRYGAMAACGVALASPWAVAATRPAHVALKDIGHDVPAPIVDEIRRAPSGKVTLVEFVDFECPYCRRLHVLLEEVLGADRRHVQLVRRHVPLAQHEHARDAARAACCAEKLDPSRQAAVADEMMRTDPERLTSEGCEQIAVTHAYDRDRWRSCVNDPSIDERIARDTAEFRATGGRGLPTLWVDGTRIEGLPTREALTQTMVAALTAHGLR